MTEINILRSGEPGYPALLKEIKDHPKELYYIGNIDLLNKRCAAIVGSRNTNQYGRSTAVDVASRLAEKDIVIVSGMARGIDTCAHRGALKVGGSTVAVLGCGVDVCYPSDNRELKKRIEEKGVVISEYPPGTEAKTYHFPQRNRIISGLSEVTIVVQARNESGALITAELAASQGRDVCAIPGNIDSQYSLGGNKLIKDGAHPIASIADVMEIMGLAGVDEKAAERLLSDTENRIFSLLIDKGETTVDELCLLLDKPPGYVSSIVTVMELKGVIFTALGKIFIAKG